MPLYLEGTGTLGLEGHNLNTPIHVVNGSTLRYTANQTDTDQQYYKEAGGVVEIDAGVTLTSNLCTFNDDPLVDDTTGAAYYVDTIGVAGDWIVNFFSLDNGLIYVTRNGLRFVATRAFNDNDIQNTKYSGKLSFLRCYTDEGDYIDMPVMIARVDDTDVDIPFIFDTEEDLIFGNDYDKITINLQFIHPKFPMVWDVSEDNWVILEDSLPITRAVILNEHKIDIVEVRDINFVVNPGMKELLSCDIELCNDTSPQEWSGYARNVITQFGLFNTAQRLIRDNNGGSILSPPIGVYLNYENESQLVGKYVFKWVGA